MTRRSRRTGSAGRSRPAGVLALGALLVLTACTSNEPDPAPSAPPSASSDRVPSDLASYYDQTLSWSECPAKYLPADAETSDYDCTTISVPRSYDDLSLGSFELAALRYKSENPKGTLFINPGGPGGSAIETASFAPGLFGQGVLDTYDVVGVDPRGVQNSDPVECIDDQTRYAMSTIEPTPDTPDEQEAVVDLSAKVGVGCKQNSPQIAPYIGTTSAVRDMDITRAAFGREKLDFLGLSYGTLLGATYAELFPDNVGRLVLDGVLPSDLDSDDLGLGQAKGFEDALGQFVAECLRTKGCPLSGGVDDGVGQIQELLEKLNAQPLPGIGDRELTEGGAFGAIVNQLYAPFQWESLMAGLAAAFKGDGSVLLSQADYYNDRNSDGTYSTNLLEAFLAISCLDRPANGGLDHVREIAPEWAKEAPTMGAAFAWSSLPCWQWPLGPGTAEAAGPPPVIHAKGAGPILVVSTIHDPATPYDWGVRVADQLEDATLLTYEGQGHTAYTSGSTCIQEKVDDYLLDGTMPPDGTRCPGI